MISGWIAQGMPAPQESDARVTTIQVLPHEASLRPGGEQQLIVTALFSDGHAEDVTRWAKYDSGDEGVATVDDQRPRHDAQYGEAPVTVWYQSHVTFSRLRIPYRYQLQEAVFKNAPRHNYIDDAILKHLEALHIPPSPAGKRFGIYSQSVSGWRRNSAQARRSRGICERLISGQAETDDRCADEAARICGLLGL